MKPKECWNCKGVNFRWYHNTWNELIHQCKKCLKEYFIPANEPMYSETTTYMYSETTTGGTITDINGKVKRHKDLLLRTEKEYQLIMSKRSQPTGKWVGSYMNLRYPQKKNKVKK